MILIPESYRFQFFTKFILQQCISILSCVFNTDPVPLSLVLDGWDVTKLLLPGLYKIVDLTNKKAYYGQSECVMNRLHRHHHDLTRGQHHSSGLQNAYSTDPDPVNNFKFVLLEAGPEWANKKVRERREQEYIQENQKNCYNIIEKQTNEDRIIKPIMGANVRYASIREAARATNQSRATIKRKVTNTETIEWYYLLSEQEPYGCSPIFASRDNGITSSFFESISAAVEANFANNKSDANNKLRRNKPGWRYAHPQDSDGSRLRTPYTLKPGEIAFDPTKIDL